jgi:hypothetical protein
MLPSSGSNRVEVDGTSYRYIVSEFSALLDGTIPLAVTVQLRDRNGAYLRAVGLTAIPVPKVLSESRSERRRNQAIKPRQVARLIRLGLAHGWDPKSPGPVFLLQVSHSDVFFEAHTE